MSFSQSLTILLLFAGHAVASAQDSTLTLGKAGEATIETQEANDKAELKIHLPDGSIQLINGLGEHFQFLVKDGQSEKITKQDFDGDGQQEFVVRVTGPTKASHVYVYKYRASQHKFQTLPFADDDHLVADYNEPVEILSDGIAYEMEVLNTEDEAKTSAPGRMKVLWIFREKRFLPF
ncbi:MAG: hypothetical protein ACXWQO_01150 [Bdellovibrionota bacterium]